MPDAALRAIPQLHALIESAQGQELAIRYPRGLVVDACRARIDAYRAALRDGSPILLTADDLLREAQETLESDDRERLQPVINATGIVIHTNLGRAPIARSAADAAHSAGINYSNLEYDLNAGKRGKRVGNAEKALCRLTGAEAAVIVNNNAAAILLMLAAAAPDGGEVILSRGEMVEIGGSFRIPDILRASGAGLVEIGATNRTHLHDYERAVTPNTKAILRVHASNFRMVGFTKQTSMTDLSALAKARGLLLMEDLGSGALIDLTHYGLPKEPTPQNALNSGADIVTFSGDKLLGGPQAGIAVGRAEIINKMTVHPLYRALRADKMCLAALDATLAIYESGGDALRESLPVLRMLTEDDAALLKRARRLKTLLQHIPSVRTNIERGESFAGGGAMPESPLPTRKIALAMDGISAGRLAERLRRANPPIIAVVHEEQLFLDVRTIQNDQLSQIAAAVKIISGEIG